MTSSIAYSFVKKEAVANRGVNICFQLAMFAGLIFRTVTQGKNLFAVEALIILMFCMGGMGAGTLPPEIETAIASASKGLPSLANLGVSTVGGLIWYMLSLGFSSYGVWFVFKGMDGMQHTPCSTYAFFFVRVNLFNGYRIFLKITFCVGVIFHGPATLQGMIAMASAKYRYIVRKEYQDNEAKDDRKGTPTTSTDPLPANAPSGGNSSESQVLSVANPTASTDPLPADAPSEGSSVEIQTQSLENPTASTDPLPADAPSKGISAEIQAQSVETPTASTDPLPDLLARVESLVASFTTIMFSSLYVFSAIGIELTIKWNHISGVNQVNSTGQLLPLVVGVAGSLRVLLKWVDPLEKVTVFVRRVKKGGFLF